MSILLHKTQIDDERIESISQFRSLNARNNHHKHIAFATQ